MREKNLGVYRCVSEALGHILVCERRTLVYIIVLLKHYDTYMYEGGEPSVYHCFNEVLGQINI